MATMTSTSGDEESAWKVPYLERLSEAGIKVLGVRDNPRFDKRVPDCCPDDHCPAAQDGLLIYRDNDHLTTTWTLLRGGTIHNALRDLLGLDADPESVT